MTEPVTVESIARAKAAQQREREQFTQQTGYHVDSDGRIMFKRTVAALAACLLLASPLYAQDQTPVSKKLYATFFGASALNETLTLVNMSHGLHETNPAYPAHNVPAHIATFAAFQALDLFALKAVERQHPTMAKVFLYGLIGLQGSVTAWEAHNLRK